MMAKRTWKAIIAILMGAPLLAEAADALSAQGRQPDIAPPLITHVPQETYRTDAPVRIHARVTDESGVREVVLFYRKAGEQEYRQTFMRRDRAGDFYVAELPSGSGPSIEYFIRASDTVGNTVLGRLFDPYVTTVVAADETVTPSSAGAVSIPLSPPPAQQTTTRTTQPALETRSGERSGLPRWVWIGLGVVAVAAVAAGAGGGGGGGGDSAPSAPTDSGVGTVTITAPVP